jgi:hypothetical protein
MINNNANYLTINTTIDKTLEEFSSATNKNTKK